LSSHGKNPRIYPREPSTPNSLNVLEIISFATPPVTNPPHLLLIEELFSKM